MMIIVNLTGQLGNQMFQYVLGRHLEQQGKSVKYNVAYFKQHSEHYFDLSRFGIEIPIDDEKKVLAFQEDRHRVIDCLRRKVFGRRLHVFSEIGAKSYAFRPEVFSFKKGYIDGYWQSEKYFVDIADDIRRLFTFPNSSNPRSIALGFLLSLPHLGTR